MKNCIQKPSFTGMVLNFLIVLVSLSYGAAMDAPSTEFNALDLVSLGVFSASSRRPSFTKAAKVAGSSSASSLSSSTTQRALLIATPKKGAGSAHPSVPFITVDVTQASSGCGPFDWLFRPDCSPPRINLIIHPVGIDGSNKVVLKASILYVYNLPAGAENVRITLPKYGSCGRDGENSRTGTMRLWTQGNLCNRARFRRRECKRRLLFFRKCSLKDCDTLTFVSRVIVLDSSGTTTMPYIASGDGIETCPNGEIGGLFLK